MLLTLARFPLPGGGRVGRHRATNLGSGKLVMRTVYHEQLSDLDREVGEMCALAGAVMKQAT
jgi:hypothetical protein